MICFPILTLLFFTEAYFSPLTCSYLWCSSSNERRVDLAHVIDVLVLMEVVLWFFEVIGLTFSLQSVVVIMICELVLQTDLFCSQPNGNPFIILYLFLESVALFFEQADLYFKLFCLVQVRLAILGLPKLVILSLGRHSTAWPKFKLTARHLYSYFRVILSVLWTDDWFFPWPGIFLE